MDAIIVNQKKIILKFSEEELALLCNALNEVCNGIRVPEFDLHIGAPIENAEILLKFIGSSYRKVKKIRLDEMTDS